MYGSIPKKIWFEGTDERLCGSFGIPFLSHTHKMLQYRLIEGSLEVRLPTIWTDEKQRREEAERRERLEERRVEEKESEESRCRCVKR